MPTPVVPTPRPPRPEVSAETLDQAFKVISETLKEPDKKLRAEQMEALGSIPWSRLESAIIERFEAHPEDERILRLGLPLDRKLELGRKWTRASDIGLQATGYSWVLSNSDVPKEEKEKLILDVLADAAADERIQAHVLGHVDELDTDQRTACLDHGITHTSSWVRMAALKFAAEGTYPKLQELQKTAASSGRVAEKLWANFGLNWAKHPEFGLENLTRFVNRTSRDIRSLPDDEASSAHSVLLEALLNDRTELSLRKAALRDVVTPYLKRAKAHEVINSMADLERKERGEPERFESFMSLLTAAGTNPEVVAGIELGLDSTNGYLMRASVEAMKDKKVVREKDLERLLNKAFAALNGLDRHKEWGTYTEMIGNFVSLLAERCEEPEALAMAKDLLGDPSLNAWYRGFLAVPLYHPAVSLDVRSQIAEAANYSKEDGLRMSARVYALTKRADQPYPQFAAEFASEEPQVRMIYAQLALLRPDLYPDQQEPARTFLKDALAMKDGLTSDPRDKEALAETAMLAIQGIDEPWVLEAIEKAVSSEEKYNPVGREAAKALRGLYGERAEKALRKAMESKDRICAANAARSAAMNSLGDPPDVFAKLMLTAHSRLVVTVLAYHLPRYYGE